MALFFGIILLTIAILFVYMIIEEGRTAVSFSALGALTIIFIIVGINIIDDSLFPSITPIDVYRGRTTLEITYKDNIAIDNIVVWKEERGKIKTIH